MTILASDVLLHENRNIQQQNVAPVNIEAAFLSELLKHVLFTRSKIFLWLYYISSN